MEESFSLRVFRSDHPRSRSRVVAECVRETSIAFDSSEKGAYQQSVESKVNEFAEHCRYWFGVVAVWGKGGVARPREVTTLACAWRSMRGTARQTRHRIRQQFWIDNKVYKVQYTVYLPSTTRIA